MKDALAIGIQYQPSKVISNALAAGVTSQDQTSQTLALGLTSPQMPQVAGAAASSYIQILNVNLIAYVLFIFTALTMTAYVLKGKKAEVLNENDSA